MSNVMTHRLVTSLLIINVGCWSVVGLLPKLAEKKCSFNKPLDVVDVGMTVDVVRTSFGQITVS